MRKTITRILSEILGVYGYMNKSTLNFLTLDTLWPLQVYLFFVFFLLLQTKIEVFYVFLFQQWQIRVNKTMSSFW